MRFLGLAIFAGWIFAAGGAYAQSYEPSGNMTWPQTPEIGDNPPPTNPRRSLSRLPTESWPGTDAPPVGIPPKIAEEPSAPAQAAQPGGQGSAPVAQSAQDTQPRGPGRASRETSSGQRTDAIGRPEPGGTATANPLTPPLPHRNMAAAMQTRAAVAAVSPAMPVTAAVPGIEPAAAPHLPVAAALPEPVAIPAPAPAETAPPHAATVAAVEPVAALPATPQAPAVQIEAPKADNPVASPVAPAPEPVVSTAPAQPEPAAPPPASVEIAAANPAPPVEPTARVTETPATGPAQPASSEAPATAPVEPTPSEAPADKAAVPEIQQVAAAPVDAAPAPATPAAASIQTPQPVQQAKADDGLTKLIGQMIVTGFEGAEPGDPGVKAVTEQLRKGRIGGVIVASRNIRATRQLKALVAALRDAGGSAQPLLMIVHEGGAGQSMTPEKGFSAYPSAAALGRSNDPLNAFNVYQYMAEELAAYGFNVNLGPVVDLDPATEIDEAAVEGRSYGIVPKHVAAFAKAFRLAHHQKNILTALKHFPPQAAGAAPAGVEAADADPLNTFRELIDSEDADLVMASNLPAAGETGEGALPATLSEGVVRKQLREQLGYDGVVLSGDLQAAELAGRWGLEERVTRAVAAGNDLLLAGVDNPPAPDLATVMAAAIANAVEKGTIARETLEAASNRIAKLKGGLGNPGNAVASADGKSQEKPAAR